LSAAHPKVISECFRALALWSLGYADQADAVSDALLAHARALGDPYSLAYALNFAALLVPALRGEYRRAVDRADEGIGLARELGYPFMELSGTVFRVWPASHLFAPAELLDVKDQGLARLRTLGSMYHHPHLLARRARLLIRLGRAEEARDSALQALGLIEESGESSIEADAHLAAGESWEAAGSAHLEQAQACYEKALETARKQQAKAWELRAAVALARLWRRQGRREKIRDLVAPVYGWFTEGHDTADLREAAALLSELR
jgi:predicted ATPase